MASPASLASGRSRARRSGPLATAALGTVALAATTSVLVARLVAVWPEALAAARQWPTPGTLTIYTLVAAPLLATGALVAAWWTLSLLLVTVTLTADRAGRHSAALMRCIEAVAPRTLRRLAVAGIGAGLTFSALPAQAAQEPPDVGWTTTEERADPAHRAVDAAPPTPGAAGASTRPELTPTAPAVATQAGTPISDQDQRVAPADPTSLGALVPLAEAPAAAVRPVTPSGTVSSAPVPTPDAAPTDAQPATVQQDTAQPDDTARPDLAAGVVVVAPGDTLWDLAAGTLPAGATDAEITASWHAWYELNRAVVGDNPDRLHPGQLLQAPPLP